MTHFKILLSAFLLIAFFCAGLKIGITNCDNKKPVNTTVVNTPKPDTDSNNIWYSKTTTKIEYVNFKIDTCIEWKQKSKGNVK